MSHIESRKLNHLDIILNTEPPKLKEYNAIFKEIVHKQDKQGHVVKIIPLRKCELKRLKTELTTDELKQVYYYNMEKTIKSLLQNSNLLRIHPHPLTVIRL